MGIFRKPAGPIGEIEASLEQLRRKRDLVATSLGEAKASRAKAENVWESAVAGNDSKSLEKTGARLCEAKEFVTHLEAALDDYARQIDEAEAELLFAQDHSSREAKAALLDNQLATIEPLFDHYAAAAGRFANELSKIEGLFDAEAAASIIWQTSEAVQGAKQSILEGMRFLSAELRRDPPPRAPERLAAGVLPRGIVPNRNDPHEPAMWAGDRAFP